MPSFLWELGDQLQHRAASGSVSIYSCQAVKPQVEYSWRFLMHFPLTCSDLTPAMFSIYVGEVKWINAVVKFDALFVWFRWAKVCMVLGNVGSLYVWRIGLMTDFIQDSLCWSLHGTYRVWLARSSFSNIPGRSISWFVWIWMTSVLILRSELISQFYIVVQIRF